jgi:hypothetical protein
MKEVEMMRAYVLCVLALLLVFQMRVGAAHASDVAVGEDLVVRFDGEPFFPVGIYHMPTSDEPYRELADAGFNLVRAGASRDQLDKAHAAGLKAWVPIGGHLTFDKEVDAKRAKLAEVVDGLKDHPALLAWESVDEPAWTHMKAEQRVPAAHLAAGYRALRELDPNHPVWLNHAPANLVETMREYNAAADIIACDTYPVIVPGLQPMYALWEDGYQGDLLNVHISQVGEYVEKMKRVAGPEKPVWMVLQGFAWAMLEKEEKRQNDKIRFPTYDETRFMAYDAIVHGAKGILYWGVGYTPQPSPFWSDLKRVVNELSGLHDVLAAPTRDLAVGVRYHELGHSVDTGVAFLAKAFEGDVYLFTVNDDKNPVKVTFTLPQKRDGTLDVVAEDRDVPVKAGCFTESYKPFDVHVYRIPAAAGS